MAEWKTVTLSDLGEIVGGATPATSHEEYYNGDIPWLTPKDLAGYSYRYIHRGERNITQAGLKSCSTRIVPKNTVLFSSRAPIGYIAIANNDICTNQGFKSIVPNADVSPLFLYYLLKFYKDEIEAMGSGTTFKEVSGATMRNIKVRIPVLLDDQERIASILDSLDSKIELNQKINDNLQQQVFSLYDYWFMVFNRTDGVLPSGWCEGTIGDIATVASGKRPPMRQASSTADVQIPLVGAASVMGYTNAALYEEPILVTGRVGTHGIVQRFQTPCWASDNTLVIKSVFYEFIYQILQRIDYTNMNRGSTQPLITQTDLKNVSIVLPPNSVLHEFEKFAGALMSVYEANRKENRQLAALRDTLLPKLMSGETDVSDINMRRSL